MLWRRWVEIPALVGLFLLAGCAAQEGPEIHAIEGPPPDFPAAVYRKAFEGGQRVYRVDDCLSRVVVRVYSGGPLAKLGHNHVVSTRQIRGYVLDSSGSRQGRADLYVPVTTLAVDDPLLVKKAGFETELSEQEKADTRYHMLAFVLEAQKFPYVRIHAVPGSKSGKGADVLTLDLTIHGVTRTRQVPVRIRRSGDWLEVQGKLGIRHADFGMKPYTALGGQLRVQEKMDLRFLIHAVPVERWGGGEGAAGRGMVAKGCGRSPRPEAAVGQGAPLNPAK